MSSDRTEHQSSEELQRTRQLSREPARPPAHVPGYRLQRFVGSGAFGEVWSATNLKTGRRVAIKFYTRRKRDDVRQLAREVEKLVVLSADRYVVQLLDVGWDAEPPYYVMEYIEHGSLEDRLKSEGSVAVAEAVELFQEIANGMMHLHGKGILHCDLKPGNVLLDQDGKPRVADFGQARLSNDETPALGTLFYMAPEQADVTAMPDAAWDVYGLGALLYSMITGHPPYYSESLAQEIENTDAIGDRLSKYRDSLMSGDLPTAHRAHPRVDRALADLIDRCIAADPAKRFRSIQSVLLTLRQREVNRARRPLMLLGIIGPLLLMTVVAVFGWYAFNQAIGQTSEAVNAKAVESNEFAAELAARSAAEQIDEYFRVVSRLARDPQFLDEFYQVIDNPEIQQLRMRLADPRDNAVDPNRGPDPLAAVRKQLIQHPLRRRLQLPLERRLADPDREFPPAASWFVCDRYGNQIASVFPDDNRTLANNYAFRTYFNGESSDLALDHPQLTVDHDVPEVGSEPGWKALDAQLRGRKVIQAPHLSAVFKSEQSERWKVAFSMPILRDGTIEGVVAVTVELGGLVDFARREHQYAMLVDGRQGENTGVVLEHPTFPEELVTVYVDLDRAIDEPRFEDPIGATRLGKQLGYGQPSLVSIVDVTMDSSFITAGNGDDQETDSEAKATGRQPTQLYVLAVQDYGNVSSDVDALRFQLLWLAGLALLTLLLVGASIAYIVNGLLRESREKLARSFAPARDTSNFHELETIADVQQRQHIPRD